MHDTLVLGAGIAGLTVAWRLRRAGRAATVMEARDRVGGRAFSPRQGGHLFDLGPSWVWDHETAVHALLKALDVATFPSREHGDDLVDLPTGLHRGRMPTSFSPERRIVGGAQAIAEALAAQLPNDAVVVGKRARVILEVGDHLQVTFEDGDSVAARRVVAAYPPPLVAKQLTGLDPATERRLARTPIWMGDIAKAVAIYDEPFWRQNGLSGRAFSRVGPMVELHDLSGPTDAEGTALFGFVPREVPLPGGGRADEVELDVLEDAVRSQLRRIFGSDAPSPRDVVIKAWWRDPDTVPPSLEAPDEALFGHNSLRQPLLDGRLLLASTETASQNTGHIEGAVRRALEVAEALLESGP